MALFGFIKQLIGYNIIAFCHPSTVFIFGKSTQEIMARMIEALGFGVIYFERRLSFRL
uniref:Uncharacterized protein K0253H11.17 n=1 Tax=Oryza sativa subsp. indica TaxID=39946 RepID=C8TFL0_ORYSI|nr:hypothetical protein [Oryza sativa Indica Group]